MFRKDFKWGCATAATQIEGAYLEDGKVLSNWDERCRKGLINNKDNCFIACDSYHRYHEDILLLKKLGANAYRFSIAWPRIIKDKKGSVNKKGLAHYHKVIDDCLKHGIEPFITLYHWDHPLFIDKDGAWSNADIVKHFIRYVDVVVKEFAPKVKHFITINEIPCILDGLGHIETQSDAVPIKRYKNSKSHLIVLRHLLLAHGHAMKIIHKYHAFGGIAPNSVACVPVSKSKKDIDAARKAYFDIVKDDVYAISIFNDPIILGKFPKRYFEVYSDKERPVFTKKDLSIISEPLDFYCQNIYVSRYIKSDGKGGYIDIGYSKKIKSGYIDWNRVTPDALYWGVKFLSERYKLPIYISENGFSLDDHLSKNKIHDKERSNFISKYLRELKKASEEHIDIRGYFYWSLLDNFEWFKGYGPRFGIVYVDYKTLKRYPKDSYFTYQNIIKHNGRNL